MSSVMKYCDQLSQEKFITVAMRNYSVTMLNFSGAAK